jgi:gliding motility-associated lipoprotein GldH
MIIRMKRKSDKLILSGLLALFVGVLISCSTDPHYDKFYSFKKNEWSQNVLPAFEINVQDTTKWYDMVITLRTTTDYSHSNFWFFLNTKTPSDIEAREPFQLRIADEAGRWLGLKSGTVIENKLLFRKRKFPEKGKYQFILEQGITQETIQEVLSVGITMHEHGSN